MLKHPSVAWLVSSATLALLVVTAAVGWFVYGAYRASSEAEKGNTLHVERMRLLGDTQQALMAQLGSLMAAPILNLPEQYATSEANGQLVISNLSALEELVPPGDPLRETLDQALLTINAAEPLTQQTIDAARAGRVDEAFRLALDNDLQSQMTNAATALKHGAAIEADLLRESQATENDGRYRMLEGLLAIGATWLIVGLTLAIGTQVAFSKPLQNVSKAARAMAAGQGGVRAPAAGVRELVDVSQAVNTLRDELTRRSGEMEEYLSKNLEARTAELEATNRELLRAMGERQRAEDALRSSEMQLRLAMEAAEVGTWEWDIATGAVSWSESVEAIFEPAPPGFQRTIVSWLELVYPEDRARIARVVLDAVRSPERRFQLESRYVSVHDGGIRWLRVAGEVVVDDLGQPVRAFGTAMNVTAEREREEALARSEEGLRAAQRLTGLSSFDWNIRADTVVWSEGMFDLLALAPAAVQPSYALFMSLVHRDDLEAFEARIARAFAGEPNPPLDCRIVRGDGAVRYVQAVVHVDFTAGGEPDRMIATFLDVTAARLAEQSLRQQRELVAAVVASAPIVLYATDANGIFTVSQGLGLAKLGLQPGEAVGQSVWDLYRDFPEIVEATKRALTGESSSYVANFGDTLFEVAQVPLMEGRRVQGMVGVAVDTSERAKLQEQLLQAQKMESVGRLAGGVAHDFNNLLSAIIGYSELAAAGLEPESQARQDIQEAVLAANKAATLTRQLLAFARRQMVEPEDVDVSDVVANLEKLLRRLIGEDIQFTCKTASERLVARVDPGQFEQVLVNLAVNARDAMPEGGKLIIETGRVVLDDAYAASRADVRAGPHVVVAVSDTGTGMAPAVLEHIFEPFYTTKEQGKGTGLGLATCYGIVKQAGGHISVYSELGFGTTFKVYLPQIGSTPAAAGPAPAVRAAYQRGSERILLVEDQPEVRLLTERVLASHGYNVISAPNPMKALELASGHESIDLIISDVVMPGMDGVTMVDVLLRMLGPLPVILMSGYAEESIISRAMGRPGVEFVSKPLSPESLLMKTREVLSTWREAHRGATEADEELAG